MYCPCHDWPCHHCRIGDPSTGEATEQSPAGPLASAQKKKKKKKKKGGAGGAALEAQVRLVGPTIAQDCSNWIDVCLVPGQARA